MEFTNNNTLSSSLSNDLGEAADTDIHVDTVNNRVSIASNDGYVTEPTLGSPWDVIMMICTPELAPIYFLNFIAFAAMFTSLTLLPLYLSVGPYNLSQSIIGVTFLPVGVAMMVGAIVGGNLSDFSAKVFNSSVEGRLLYPLIISSFLPVGAIGFGLCLRYKVSLAGVLLTQSLIGYCQATLMPSILSYLSEKIPNKAGAAASAAMLTAFGGAAIFVSISVLVSDAIGIHYFFLILAGTSLAALVFCNLFYTHMNKKVSKLKESSKQTNLNSIYNEEGL
jgi:MFS family permease